MPVAVVDDGARFRSLVAQIFRQHRERADQVAAVSDIEASAIEVRQHPLVRIETVTVGKFQAIMDKTKLRAEGGGSAHGRVYVQPEIVFAAEGADLAHGVDGGRRSRTDGRADKTGDHSCLLVRFDLAGKVVSSHGKVLIDRDHAQVVRANAGDLCCFLDRRVGLCGGVGDESAVASLLVAGELGGALSRRQEGAEVGTRSRVLDNAAADAGRQESLRQPEHRDEPVEHVRFQFGTGWTGGPEHSLHAESRGEQVTKNRCVGGKITKEIRRLPVRDSGQNDTVNIGEDLRERFALLRRVRRQLSADFSRLHARQHRKAFHAGVVIGNPIDDGMAVAAEFFGRHVGIRHRRHC